MPQQPLPPLCVDLDGTLIKTNSLFEALLIALKKNPLRVFPLVGACFQSKAHVKHLLGEYIKDEPHSWLYNEELIAFLRDEHSKERTLILATASDHAIATSIAQELGIFDEVIASTVFAPVNASTKYKVLQQRFGKTSFSYAGNSHADLSVWNIAASAVLVHTPKRIASLVQKSCRVEAEFPLPETRTLKNIIREIRIHQWLKNLLLFIPPIMAHQIHHPYIFLQTTAGFFSFSFLASSMYIMNDLLDMHADRTHETKRMRPIALGTISAQDAIKIALLLVSASIALALFILPPAFLFVLLAYIVINALYSLRLKKVPYIDITVLASLYVLRIIAGGAATNIPTSVWLFFFAGCFFFYLASLKRVIELLHLKQPQDIAPGRGYRKQDTAFLIRLGVAFSILSLVILGMYVGSTNVTHLYARPYLLLALLPLLALWMIRMWHLALAKKLPDDPVLFTSKDAISYGIGVAIIAVLGMAI